MAPKGKIVYSTTFSLIKDDLKPPQAQDLPGGRKAMQSGFSPYLKLNQPRINWNMNDIWSSSGFSSSKRPVTTNRLGDSQQEVRGKGCQRVLF